MKEVKNMLRYLINNDITIAKNDTSYIELKRGTILNETHFKYKYAINDYENKLKLLINAGDIQVIDTPKRKGTYREHGLNIDNHFTVRYSNNKVITL